MGFGEAISTCFSKYATFRGRARRSEFWFFYLFMFIVNGVIGSILAIAILSAGTHEVVTNGVKTIEPNPLNGFGIAMIVIAAIWSLATLLPMLGVQVRRLHDANHSGWWWWINLVCFGWIVLLVFWITEGTRGPNRFGPDPKG